MFPYSDITYETTGRAWIAFDAVKWNRVNIHIVALTQRQLYS
jgi:hypothetical protein